MCECIYCNHTIADNARICTSCGGNQYNSIKLVNILYSLFISFSLWILIGFSLYRIDKELLSNYGFLVKLLAIAVFFAILYNRYNTKLNPKKEKEN